MQTSPHCTRHQQTISNLRNSGIDEDHDSLLRLALDQIIEIEDGMFNNAPAEEAARHIAACEECQSWVDEVWPERALARDRLKKYCCSHMMAAVTQADEPIRFSFCMFRGEDACWCINENFSFASYCPWCGLPLPDGPFEQS
jgi:hypothetical protein